MCTLLLVVAGGLVTSNGAGLSARAVLPHVVGASVVTGMILWIVIRVLVRHSEHTPLYVRRPAVEMAPRGVTVTS
jgi:hypothetical protein